MKKYWINYHKPFGNTYSLYWTTDKQMERNLPSGAQRISRNEAIARAKANAMPWTDGYYFASEWIYPADGSSGCDYPNDWYDVKTRIVGRFNMVNKDI